MKNYKKRYQIALFLLINTYIQSIYAEDAQISEPSTPIQMQEQSSSPSFSNPGCESKVKVTPRVSEHKSLIKQPLVKPENINIYCASLPAGAVNQKISFDSGKDKHDFNLEKKELDWLGFIQKLIEALAWPIFGIFLVRLIWPEFKTLIPLIRKLKAGPVEAEFGREVGELRLETAVSQEGEVPVTEDLNQRQKLLLLADHNPRSAVLEAWREIEIAAKKTIIARGKRELSRELTSVVAISRILSDEKILNPDEISLFNELKGLRNLVTHSEDFNLTYEAALDYIELASLLLSKLTEENADSLRKAADNNVDKLNVAAKIQKEDGQGVKL